MIIAVSERHGKCVECEEETTLIVILGKGGFYICRRCLAKLCVEAERWLQR